MAETVFQIGDLIENRYRVLSLIGTGGMGALYQVADEAKAGEVMGLKTLRLNTMEAEKQESLKRFQHEFKLLTQLRHPNLVTVHDYGVTTEGNLFFTMEYVQGRSLKLRGHPKEPITTIPIIVQICRALAYLHSRGLAHGDLKPENVLIVGEQVKIIDFGVAQEMRSPETRVQYYTPDYSAPEIKLQGLLNQRSDLYSLGALWYALLAGEPPLFTSAARQLTGVFIKNILEKQTRVPVAMKEVIVTLLADDPMERYADANAVIEAINRVMELSYTLETSETARSYALRGRFVGREHEMKMLQSLWEQTQKGESRFVLIGAETGVGKSRLVEEFAVQAALDGARVSYGQCLENGGTAYHPWREILRMLIRYVASADQAFMKHAGPVLGILLPELWEQDDMAGLTPPAELDPQAAQQRLNNVIAQVLRAAAGLRPTLIVIEDAHWADEATQTLCQFLMRLSGQPGLLICVTYRSDEIDPQHSLLSQAEDRAQRILLPNLPPQATNELMHSMLGVEQLPIALMDRVQQTTGGNAFFVQELMRSLAEDAVVLQRTVEGWRVDQKALAETHLPDTIYQVVSRRLGRLSPGARDVLQCASVVGPVFWEGLLEQFAGVPKEELPAALQESLDREMILERDQSTLTGQKEYLFAKPSVREVCYHRVPNQDRRRLHQQTVAWLIARGEKAISEHLGLIADHLEKAGQITDAVSYLTRAGQQAAAQFANAEAIAYFSRALTLTGAEKLCDQYDLLLAIEKMHDLQGAREAQCHDLSLLADLAKKLNDSRRRAETALRRANYAEVTGDYAAAVRADQEAIDLARDTQDLIRQAMGHSHWGWSLWSQGEYEAARTQIEQALILARTAGAHELEAESLLNLSAAATFLYKHKEAENFLGQVLAICLKTSNRRQEGHALNRLGITWFDRSRYTQAYDYFDQAWRIFRAIGQRRGESVTIGNLGLSLLHMGDFAKAETCLEQAIQIDREINHRRGECLNLSYLSLLLYYRDDYQAAEANSRQALMIARETKDRRTQGYALTYLGHALLGRKRLEEAFDAYNEAVSLRKGMDQHAAAMESLAGLARVSLAQGNLAQALEQTEEILNYLEHFPLIGFYEPLQVYWACYQVLCAHHDPRSPDVLKKAFNLLGEQAQDIADEILRRSFLENIPAHREILREFGKSREGTDNGRER